MIRIKYNRKKEGVSEMAERDYDVVVIGGGSAGYTAALYCARTITPDLPKGSKGSAWRWK